MGIEPLKTISEVGVLCSQAGEAARAVTAETSLWIRREDTMDRERLYCEPAMVQRK